MSDWDDIFEEAAIKRAAESDAYLARPEVQERQRLRKEREDRMIAREIAEGLRDEDGNLFETNEDEDLE